MENIVLTIISIVIAIIGIILTIVFERKYKKLIDYNREMAWEIYRQISISLECYQNLQKLTNKSDNKEILEMVVRGEGNDQELLLNAIKMIKRVEKKFDDISINKWVEGKIIPNESHAIAFKKYLLK